jgi:N6-L-threonylcarbamoyladenine synthase
VALLLGIETSCDDTGVAVLIPPRTLLAHKTNSQVALHRPYGGVVPEIASRAHLRRLIPTVKETLSSAGVSPEEITHVCVTQGPGLINTLLCGLGFAQGFALSRGIPVVGVNHIYGHLLSPDLVSPMRFPSLVFLATGGHTALYRMDTPVEIRCLFRTVDDAIGESFDKIAKLLGLPYPGGPEIEKMAEGGDPDGVPLPFPKPTNPKALSFSGLKTAVRLAIQKEKTLREEFLRDLCASFQKIILRVILHTIEKALKEERGIVALYFVGGVARNKLLNKGIKTFCEERALLFSVLPPDLCVDNGAMIARAGWEKIVRGKTDPWDLQPKSRWEVFV